jgi:predicted negative regulator of RcsB-dependent stress response
VVIAIVALIGWQQWGAYKQERAEKASAEYHVFRNEIHAPTPSEAALKRGDTIITEIGNTHYGPLAALLLAQYHVERGELDQAAERLRWAAKEAKGQPVAALATLRLARVLSAQKHYDEALAALQPAPKSLTADYQEVRGDVLTAAGRRDDAVAAYRAALADQGLIPQRRALIELKLNDLGVSAEPAA